MAGVVRVVALRRPVQVLLGVNTAPTTGGSLMGKWLAGILATVIAGVAIWWLTEGTRNPPRPSPPERGTPVHLTEEFDTDRPGSDYLELPNITDEQCKSECLADARCRAYTYDHNPSSPFYRHCFLKNPAPGPSRKVGDISGLKRP